MGETKGVIYSANERKLPSTKDSHSDLVMGAAKVFHWAEKKHFQLWIYGVAKDRQSTIEKVLKRLERNGRLRSVQFNGKRYPKIYALPTHTKNFDKSLERHELGCTDSQVRIYRADMNCEVKGEQVFRGCGVLPDWGIRYPNGLIYCFEFSTEDNVDEHRVIPSKIEAYRNSFGKIEAMFQATPWAVFILDVPRERVKKLVERWFPEHTAEHFVFVDYDTLKSTNMENTLDAPIYIWTNGEEIHL